MSRAKLITAPKISETLPLNLSEKLPCNAAVHPSDAFNNLLQSLQRERDRLAEKALPGTVQGETKGDKTYYRRYWYCAVKKKVVNQTVSSGIVAYTRECCAAWQRQREVERAIEDLSRWRTKHLKAFTIE
jgi:hypothetical protein